jgi:serine/threonine protein phosphatase PrpC
MKPFVVQVALRSYIGSRAVNEDCLAVRHEKGFWCLVLSDGAGGHGNGEVASQLVVQRVISGFRCRPPTDVHDLSELLLDAHDAVVAGQREMGSANTRSAMHATVVVLLIDTTTGSALWGHVGDSRLYLWREGTLNSVTRDDSVLQSVLDAGLMDAERIKKVKNRGVLLAALGSAEEAQPHVSGPFQLQPSDTFLLCSDGWWGGLEPEDLSTLLSSASTPEEWLDGMSDVTEKQADPRQDNYSAIACWIGVEAETHEAVDAAARDAGVGARDGAADEARDAGLEVSGAAVEAHGASAAAHGAWLGASSAVVEASDAVVKIRDLT